ncbi:hypothetical protein GCM10023189_28700 [Nibrella saemangeumensis]|uniref:histidine kinase n=1 Tax=Nibrella saemangeumensis TaxID=1084526 RepID=A0ABP8N054_9BACT
MEQVFDFFRRLGDTSDWPPRWQCGTWTDFHGWLYIISDLTIWMAYMAIPVILLRFLFVKRGVPLHRVFWLFGAFILLCGLTHLIDAAMFYIPAYRINALIRFLTGIVSIGTVLALIKYFNEAVGLRTSQEFEHELLFRQQALQELSRSNRELQQFAYVASHDLQSPLKTIENYLSLLDVKYGDGMDDNARKLVGVSAAAAGRMRVLIKDLLDFSRVGSVTEFVPVDLNKVIEEIREDLHDELQSSGAQLHIGPLPILNGHQTDLKQLFQNLISNGIKYRRKNVPPQISLQVKEQADYYLFSIKDNGIGIDKQYYDRIFEIFQRLHNRNDYSGTGIGLATCKKVIDIYGGKIWIDSVVGEGSTFYFIIPKVIKTVHHYAQTYSLHSVN